MTTVGDILDYLETLAPRSMKMDWDNVGLACGHFDAEVHKILVALDPMPDVFEEAKADAAIVAGMIHSGDYTIAQIKAVMAKAHVPVRLNW